MTYFAFSIVFCYSLLVLPTLAVADEQINETSAEEPSPCGANELLVNNTRKCPDFCPTSEFEVQACDYSQELGSQCQCMFNYRRHNNVCISTRSCPPFPCSGENEEFVACPPICPTDDCSQATPDGRCPLYGRIGIVLPCNPRCRCIKNYWRKNGTCVPYEECPHLQPSIDFIY